MSSVASRRYYFKPEPDMNNYYDGDINDKHDDYFEEHDDGEDVPYSSSSVDVDRSSIGSIPWADDAIKQNQLDWEAIERMLSGEEKQPPQLLNDSELKNEIAEWQRKFPQLLGNDNTDALKQHQHQLGGVKESSVLDNLLDINSISNLSLNSLEDDDEDDENELNEKLPLDTMATPTNQKPHQSHRLASLLSTNLRIRSVPLTLRRHQVSQQQTTIFRENNGGDDTSAATTPVPPTPPPRRHHHTTPPPLPKNLLIAQTAAQIPTAARRMRMPPILNVVETTRRFRGLVNSHRSFVQLTQVDQQQAKSAAMRTVHANAGGGVRKMHHSAWHTPLAASKVSSNFLNHRNAIILPAINMQRMQTTARQHQTTTTTETTSENGGRNALRSFSNSTSSLSSRGAAGRRTQHNFLLPQQQHNFNKIIATQTTTSTGTPTPSTTTGRSISAAVQHPHHREFNAFFLPYSASKFKAFK